MVQNKPDATYNKLAREEEERKVDLLEEEGGNGVAVKSLTDKLDETSELTDMQTAIKQLFPGDLGGEIYNALMIARIAPDVFIPMLKLIVVEEVMNTPAEEKISVVSVMAKIYVLLSIGLDGKGRIDHIELAGASKETEELEALGKGLFG